MAGEIFMSRLVLRICPNFVFKQNQQTQKWIQQKKRPKFFYEAETYQNITLYETREKKKPINFHISMIHDITVGQYDFFLEEVEPLIENILLRGVDVNIMLFGSAECGKRYTFEGPTSQPGVVFRSFESIFSLIQDEKEFESCVYFSSCSIKNEIITDVLTKSTADDICVREDDDRGVYISGLTKVKISNSKEGLELFKQVLYDLSVLNLQIIVSITVERVCKTQKKRSRLANLNFFVIQSPRNSKNKISNQVHWVKCLREVFEQFNSNSEVDFHQSRVTSILKNCMIGVAPSLIITNISPYFEDYSEVIWNLSVSETIFNIMMKNLAEKKKYFNAKRKKKKKRKIEPKANQEGIKSANTQPKEDPNVNKLEEFKKQAKEESEKREKMHEKEKSRLLEEIKRERKKMKRSLNLDERSKNQQNENEFNFKKKSSTMPRKSRKKSTRKNRTRKSNETGEQMYTDIMEERINNIKNELRNVINDKEDLEKEILLSDKQRKRAEKKIYLLQKKFKEKFDQLEGKYSELKKQNEKLNVVNRKYAKSIERSQRDLQLKDQEILNLSSVNVLSPKKKENEIVVSKEKFKEYEDYIAEQMEINQNLRKILEETNKNYEKLKISFEKNEIEYEKAKKIIVEMNQENEGMKDKVRNEEILKMKVGILQKALSDALRKIAQNSLSQNL